MRTAIGTLILTALAIAIAAIVVVHAPNSGTSSKVATADHGTHMGVMHETALSAEASKGSTASVPPKSIKLIVKSDDEEAVKGADGKYHDAFIPANLSVKAGQKVTVTVYNYDDMKHSFTDPLIGVNATIAAGSEKKASKTTFTFTAPAKTGEYEWFCDFPCDPYSMEHKGLMRGEVTVS